MAPPDHDTQIKVSSDAAETFVNRYYDAISRRAPILPFYVNSTTRYTKTADISINGAVVPTPADYFNQLAEQSNGHPVTYEVESFDAHVTNPSFTYEMPDNFPIKEKAESKGEMMSISVSVMGRVQYGKGREAPKRMFNESFVLWPNWEAMQKNPPKGIKQWLIASQNYRAL
ncbi:uncharacterized protein J7T54_007992 [Emericellopsis cladophorae]|uniref:NTF2 domain-containing protein n=1 Tax=Emericellopsis cladophorae TaxID=2686198 RepID=A0A9P9Y891_9HYPO|nr:uncharacterized protein J7T54_007992 [Emericellopsis cladophorae]KAI6784898.1 hypothetical protein J7T54_007992 [Emericellopsis cladophorae]